jgi:hypothetical protein
MHKFLLLFLVTNVEHVVQSLDLKSGPCPLEHSSVIKFREYIQIDTSQKHNISKFKGECRLEHLVVTEYSAALASPRLRTEFQRISITACHTRSGPAKSRGCVIEQYKINC